MTTFTNPDTLYRASAGTIPPVTWGDALNDDLNYLAGIYAYGAGVFRAASQGVTTSTDSLVLFDTVEFDPSGLYSLSTHLFTALVPGIWEVKTQVLLPGASGQCYVALFHNASSGSPTYPGGRIPCATNAGPSMTREVSLALNDTIGIDAWQSSGGTINTGGGFFTYAQFRLKCPTVLL